MIYLACILAALLMYLSWKSGRDYQRFVHHLEQYEQDSKNQLRNYTYIVELEDEFEPHELN